MKYFEDFAVGEAATVGAHLVTEQELVAVARAWDPQPTHIDLDGPASMIFGERMGALKPATGDRPRA